MGGDAGLMVWTARHFKPGEFDSPDAPNSGLMMNPAFIGKLDAARTYCNFPWRVTAGFRTEAHNKKLGGAKASYHLKGEAADISCHDSEQRFYIVAGAIAAGIKGIEVCDRHVHLDNREKCTMWTDKSR